MADSLQNILLKIGDNNQWNFVHLSNLANKNSAYDLKLQKIEKMLADKQSAASAMQYNSNVYITGRIGLSDLIYRITTAQRSNKSSPILFEKLQRAEEFAVLASNFTLELATLLRWVNVTDKELVGSNITPNKALNFAIDIGSELVKKFEQRLDQEYSIAKEITNITKK